MSEHEVIAADDRRFQAMLKQALNIECNLRTVVESVWFGDAQSGNFALAIGAMAMVMRPAGRFPVLPPPTR